MERMKSALPALIVAMFLGLVLGGAAIAGSVIPKHSVGWSNLTRGVQKKIANKQRVPGPSRATVVIADAPGYRGERGEAGEPGPTGSSGALVPLCGLVEGECLIYSEEFWRLRAALEPFEEATGLYPEPPFCMKEQAEGEPVACQSVVTYLYPDGTLGEEAWVLDSDSPKGWRFFLDP